MKQLLFTDRFSKNPGVLVKVLDQKPNENREYFVVTVNDEILSAIAEAWCPGDEVKYDFGADEFIIGNTRVKR